MTELPLDLKYRPKNFSGVIGNSSVVRLLVARSRNGTLSGRSMMFGGPKGCGKTTLARIVARAIVCDDLCDGEPCGSCESCSSISDESSTSFDEYDAATQGTIDRMRSMIQDLEYGSMDGKPRVVILDEAHRLSKASQDALLKSMEDRRLVVILCTTEPRKIVDSIRSRVEEYPISPPLEAVLVPHLENICKLEGLDYEKESIPVIARALGNCPRECVCALDTLVSWGGITLENTKQVFKYDRMQIINDILVNLDNNPTLSFSLIDELSTEGANWIRDNIILAISSSIRNSIGARVTFPIITTFFNNRDLPSWSSLAKQLGNLDKPNMIDLELVLISSSKCLPVTVITPYPAIPPSVQLTKEPLASTPPPVAPVLVSLPVATPVAVHISIPSVVTRSADPRPVTIPTPIPQNLKSKSVEIDGVKFSSDESLTSLDSKIEKGSSGPPVNMEIVSAKVEYDKRYVPLPEKEFTSGLLRKIRGN